MSWKDALQRRDEVKAAFVEGFLECCRDHCDSGRARANAAWEKSDARKRLEKPLD